MSDWIGTLAPFGASSINDGIRTASGGAFDALSLDSLCGFANFASSGIQLGGIGALAPSQRPALASLLSASIAGIFL